MGRKLGTPGQSKKRKARVCGPLPADAIGSADSCTNTNSPRNASLERDPPAARRDPAWTRNY